MEFRQLGRTRLKVSAMGMGGIPIQRISFSQAVEVVEAAIGEGVNFIDTARGYTDSETKLGQVLKNHSEVIIATKSMARSKNDMAGEIEASLQSLSLEYIHLYQLHNVKDEGTLQKILSPDGALQALKEAQQAGKVGFIGITGHIPRILVQAIKTGEFDTVQFPFNPVETLAEKELLPLAKALNLGIIAMKPFAGGAITNTGLALKYILQQGFSTVIPGMDEIDQIRENSSAVRDNSLLTPTDQRLLAEIAVELGGTFCRRCEYCQPCPKGIDIPTVFLLDGYWTRYNLQQWAVERYKALPVKASDCLKCGQCETKCPYQLPIIEMLSSAAQHLSEAAD